MACTWDLYRNIRGYIKDGIVSFNGGMDANHYDGCHHFSVNPYGCCFMAGGLF